MTEYQETQYNKYILEWKQGKHSGARGRFGAVSHRIRRYLFEKYDQKCSKCFWNKKNPTTGRVPLEVNHIDGDSQNNIEANLELLCPNCHSLTDTYRALNKGRGRKNRISLLVNLL